MACFPEVNIEEFSQLINYLKTNIMTSIFEFISGITQANNKLHQATFSAFSSRLPFLLSNTEF